MPLLCMGQLTHVGKGAVFGLGRYRIEGAWPEYGFISLGLFGSSSGSSRDDNWQYTAVRDGLTGVYESAAKVRFLA